MTGMPSLKTGDRCRITRHNGSTVDAVFMTRHTIEDGTAECAVYRFRRPGEASLMIRPSTIADCQVIA